MNTFSVSFPGYENFCEELGTLILIDPPPFIYVQDTEALPTTLSVIDALLRDLSTKPHSVSPSKVCYVNVDGVSCFSPKLLYEGIINTLVGWEPKWVEGCGNWVPENDLRWNDNMDTFLHGLCAAHAYLGQQNMTTANGKGKGKETVNDVRLVIVVERVERLKENLPDLVVPLTRLAELVCVVFLLVSCCDGLPAHRQDSTWRSFLCRKSDGSIFDHL